MALRKIIILLIPLFFLISCNKLNREGNNDDNYYVKYIAYENSSRIMLTDVTINTSDGIMSFPASSEFEKTIGPVKKGFKASITVNGKGYSGNPAYIEIHVRKNNEPFAIKVVEEGDVGTGINDVGYGYIHTAYVIGSDE